MSKKNQVLKAQILYMNWSTHGKRTPAINPTETFQSILCLHTNTSNVGYCQDGWISAIKANISYNRIFSTYNYITYFRIHLYWPEICNSLEIPPQKLYIHPGTFFIWVRDLGSQSMCTTLKEAKILLIIVAVINVKLLYTREINSRSGEQELTDITLKWTLDYFTVILKLQ